MKKRISLITVVFVAVMAAAIAPAISAQSRSVLAEAQRVTGDRFSVVGRTPRGATIYAVRRPSAAMLNAIDRGLSDLFAVSLKNGYRRGLSHRNFTIYIGRADRTQNAAGQYSPDIAVGAAQYAGTDFDQGGFIYAAGMVISNNPMSFVIAEHTTQLNRVSDIVRYEGEHLILYHNDRRRYSQTADHSRGGGHPILQ